MTERCFFCGSDDILLPSVGIALGTGVEDYSFCGKCLREKSAEVFWKLFFETEGYSWPPEWEEEGQQR